MEAPETLDGWFSLHDLRRMNWPAWRALPQEQRDEIVTEASQLLQSAEDIKDAAEGTSATYSILGHKADLLMMHLRPTVKELLDLESAFSKSRLAAYMERTYSYLSVVELARHTSAEGAAATMAQTEYVQRRMKPTLPEHSSHICFYPMDKKRGEAENWYTLSTAERAELMRSHSMIGRKYAGKVTQIITGSMGLDDWEWGVTLFADDPLQFKKLIYEMRFDEVSSKYAVFGSFYIGVRLLPNRLDDLTCL